MQPLRIAAQEGCAFFGDDGAGFGRVEFFGDGVFYDFGFQDGELDEVAVDLGDLRDDLLLADGVGLGFTPSPALRPDRLRPLDHVGFNEGAVRFPRHDGLRCALNVAEALRVFSGFTPRAAVSSGRLLARRRSSLVSRTLERRLTVAISGLIGGRGRDVNTVLSNSELLFRRKLSVKAASSSRRSGGGDMTLISQRGMPFRA